MPNVDYNTYEGKKIRGVVETVLSRGEVVIENGEYKGNEGDGQFLKRGTRCPASLATRLALTALLHWVQITVTASVSVTFALQ